MSDNLRLDFKLCLGADICLAHLVGIRNIEGHCYCTLAAFWIISNDRIMNQLLTYDRRKANRDEVEKFHTILLDLIAMRDAGIPLNLSSFMKAINFDPFDESGGYPWLSHENLIMKLEGFGISACMDIVTRPCGCNNDLRPADIYYLECSFRKTFDATLRTAFILPYPTMLRCSHEDKDTPRKNLIVLTNLPQHLGIKFGVNTDMKVPMEFELSNEFMTDDLWVENKSIVYRYRGHTTKEGLKKEEHTVGIFEWNGLLHQVSDEKHRVCAIPEKEFFAENIDFLVYEKILKGKASHDAYQPTTRSAGKK